MNRIDNLFRTKKKRVLSVYFTAGYPNIDSSENIILLLEKSGVDMIEIGIPYSDPLADGKVIQDSGKIALENGMTIKTLFLQLEHIREKTSIPILLMSYFNPVLQFGYNEFCSVASAVGIDGFIIPDMPLFEYENIYRKISDLYGLKNVFLITPDTSEQRIRKIDSISTGFLYIVSSTSTTGKTKSFGPDQIEYFKKVTSMGLVNPVMAGFGIHDNHTLEQVFSYCQGAIIGSAYIRSLSGGESIELATNRFFSNLNLPGTKSTLFTP